MKNNDMYCDKCGAKTVNGLCPYCQAEELRKAPKNKGPIIGTVIIGVIILAAILFVAIGYFPNNKEANKETQPVNNSSSQSQTTSKKNEEYLVNAFSDSGIYVRSGPGANYPDVLYIKKNDTSVRLLKTGETTGDDGYTWYTVDIPGGDSGYVREDVVINESEIEQKKQDNSAASDWVSSIVGEWGLYTDAWNELSISQVVSGVDKVTCEVSIGWGQLPGDITEGYGGTATVEYDGSNYYLYLVEDETGEIITIYKKSGDTLTVKGLDFDGEYRPSEQFY